MKKAYKGLLVEIINLQQEDIVTESIQSPNDVYKPDQKWDNGVIPW